MLVQRDQAEDVRAAYAAAAQRGAPTDKITPGEPTSQARSVDFDRSFDDCRFAITDAL